MPIPDIPGQPRIAVIGLGNMGSALADRLIAQGFGITVWNRSPGKAQAYAGSSAKVADSVAGAAESSDIILVCLLDHAATMTHVAIDAVAPALRGKTLVQLTSMTAESSRALGAWADDHDVGYLEGQIQDYPDTVREGAGTIVCAGPDTVYASCKTVLEAIAGRLVYASQSLGSASTLVNAQLAFSFMAYAGMLHGLAMCQKAGVSVEVFRDVMVRDYVKDGPFSDDLVAMAATAQSRAFDDTVGATLPVWLASLQEILAENHQEGLGSDHLKAVERLMREAIEAGHGDHDFAAVIEAINPRG